MPAIGDERDPAFIERARPVLDTYVRWFRPEVRGFEHVPEREPRAVLVTEGGRLVGVVTRKTLVREVVAHGLDPKETELRAIAEAPHFTIGPDIPLEEAFRFLETEDAERVPVVDEHHRLIGVLSRSVLQRRLAEDDPPAPLEAE